MRFKIGQKVVCRHRGKWLMDNGKYHDGFVKDGQIVTVKWYGPGHAPWQKTEYILVEETKGYMRADMFEPLITDAILKEALTEIFQTQTV